MPVVMGTMEECFQHFAATYPTEVSRPLLVEFCDVVPDTVYRWMKDGGRPPIGEVGIRLRVFLELAGYRVSELDAVSRTLRQLSRIIGLRLLSLKEVQQELDYNEPQGVLRLLKEGTGVLADRRIKLERLLANSKDELERRLVMWKARIEDTLGIEPEKKPRPSPRPTPSPAEDDADESSLPGSVAVDYSEDELQVLTPVEVIDHLVAALSFALDTVRPEQVNVLRAQIGSKRLRHLIDQTLELGE